MWARSTPSTQARSSRAEDVLEEQHLELDRVLDRVAVVLHAGRGAGRPRQSVDEGAVDGGLAERGGVGLACEAELLGTSHYGEPEHDEGAVPQGGYEPSADGDRS